MKSDFNNIDDLFKESLGRYTEAPPPDVWDALERRLDNDRKRRPFAWGWWMIGVLCVCLFGSLLAWKITGTSTPSVDGAEVTATASVQQTQVSSSLKTNVNSNTSAVDNSVAHNKFHKKHKHNNNNESSFTQTNTTNQSNSTSQITKKDRVVNKNILDNSAVAMANTEPIGNNGQGISDAKSNAIRYMVNNKTHNNIVVAENTQEQTAPHYAVADEAEEDNVTFGRKSNSVSNEPAPHTFSSPVLPIAKTTVALRQNKRIVNKNNAHNNYAGNMNAGIASVGDKSVKHITDNRYSICDVKSAKKSTTNPAQVSTTTVDRKVVSATKLNYQKVVGGNAINSSSIAQNAETKRKAANVENTTSIQTSALLVTSGETKKVNVARVKHVTNKVSDGSITKTAAHNITNPVKSVAHLNEKAATVSQVAVSSVVKSSTTTVHKKVVKNMVKNAPLVVVEKPKKHKKEVSELTIAATTEQTKKKDVATVVNKTTNTLAVVNMTHNQLTQLSGANNPVKTPKVKKSHTKNKEVEATTYNVTAYTPVIVHKNKKHTVTTSSSTSVADKSTIDKKVVSAATVVANKKSKNVELVTASKKIRINIFGNEDDLTDLSASMPVAAKIPGTFKADAPIQAKHGEQVAAITTSDSATKYKFSGFTYGLKTGYEGGFTGSASSKMVIAPFLERQLTSKFSLMLQPAIKMSKVRSNGLGGSQTYYKTDPNGSVTTLDTFLIPVIQNNQTYGYLVRINLAYKETHDSIVKSYATGGNYLEFELPVLLKYAINNKLSVYGGVSLNYSKYISIKENTFTSKPIFVNDTTFTVYPAAAPAISNVLQYTGKNIASYSGPLYPGQTGGLLRLGYMLGFSYELKKRWMVDALIQKNATKSNVQGGYDVNKPLSTTYFRLTLGYRLSQ